MAGPTYEHHTRPPVELGDLVSHRDLAAVLGHVTQIGAGPHDGSVYVITLVHGDPPGWWPIDRCRLISRRDPNGA